MSYHTIPACNNICELAYKHLLNTYIWYLHFSNFYNLNLQLCADGYDVTNLVSADPGLRRRGFKLEYFLRPPVQVRLGFERSFLAYLHLQIEDRRYKKSQVKGLKTDDLNLGKMYTALVTSQQLHWHHDIKPQAMIIQIFLY